MHTDASQQPLDSSGVAAAEQIGTADPPIVAADPSIWHPIRCARVRDAERDPEQNVEYVDDVGDRRTCLWCQLFVDC